MKVKLLRNPAESLRCELLEGEDGIVNKELGEKLIDLGIAISADKDVETEAKKPAIAEAKPASIKAKSKEPTPKKED